MKIFTYIALGISILVFGFALYYEFEIVPNAKYSKQKLDEIRSYAMELENMRSQETGEYVSIHPRDVDSTYTYHQQIARQQVDVGNYVWIGALVAFVLSVIPLFKNHHLAWIAVVLSLSAFFMGAARSTHMLAGVFY